MTASPTQDCTHCKAPILVTKDNTMLVVSRFQPWFNCARTDCPKCQKPSVFFFGPQEYVGMTLHFQDMGCTVIEADYPDDDSVKEWEQMFKMHPLGERVLTKRFLDELNLLHKVLEGIPNDLLWAELTDPEPPHDKPQRWT